MIPWNRFRSWLHSKRDLEAQLEEKTKSLQECLGHIIKLVENEDHWRKLWFQQWEQCEEYKKQIVELENYSKHYVTAGKEMADDATLLLDFVKRHGLLDEFEKDGGWRTLPH